MDDKISKVDKLFLFIGFFLNYSSAAIWAWWRHQMVIESVRVVILKCQGVVLCNIL